MIAASLGNALGLIALSRQSPIRAVLDELVPPAQQKQVEWGVDCLDHALTVAAPQAQLPERAGTVVLMCGIDSGPGTVDSQCKNAFEVFLPGRQCQARQVGTGLGDRV